MFTPVNKGGCGCGCSHLAAEEQPARRGCLASAEAAPMVVARPHGGQRVDVSDAQARRVVRARAEVAAEELAARPAHLWKVVEGGGMWWKVVEGGGR